MIYLTLEELLIVADRAVDGEVQIRDAGLLESALARPQTTIFGEDAYPNLHTKAAALLLSLCANRALVDGNKRLAFAGTLAFLGMNGWRLTMTNDQAYDFILDIAAGNNREIEYVASYLQEFSEPRRQG